MDQPEQDPAQQVEIDKIINDLLGPEIEELLDLAQRIYTYQGDQFDPQALLGQRIPSDRFMLEYDVYTNTKAGRLKCSFTLLPLANNSYFLELVSDEPEPKAGQMIVTKNADGSFDVDAKDLEPFTPTTMFDAMAPVKARYAQIVESLNL